MASGDTLLLLTPAHSTPPATVYATQDTIPGGSTPAEAVPCLDFDPDQSEYADWSSLIMPAHYGDGGLTVVIHWSASAATGASKVRWEAGLRRLENADDINAAHTYDTNGVSTTEPGAVGTKVTSTITFTTGADMDSVTAGDRFIFRVFRDHDHADDGMAGDAELQSIEIKET